MYTNKSVLVWQLISQYNKKLIHSINDFSTTFFENQWLNSYTSNGRFSFMKSSIPNPLTSLNYQTNKNDLLSGSKKTTTESARRRMKVKKWKSKKKSKTTNASIAIVFSFRVDVVDGSPSVQKKKKERSMNNHIEEGVSPFYFFPFHNFSGKFRLAGAMF